MKKFLLAFLVSVQAIAQTTVIPNDKLQVGKNTNTAKEIILNKGSGASNPRIKWNNSTSKIEFSNDGAIFKPLGSGSGGGGTNGIGVNLLAELNPGAEDGTGSWTTSGGSFTRTTTAANVLSGTASFVWDAASSGDKVMSSAVTLSDGLYGRACEARINYIGGDANNILEVVNNDAEVLGSLQLSAHTLNGPESVFFACPTSTAVGLDADKGIIKLQIRQNTGSNAASLTFDDAYIGDLSQLAETTLPDVFSAKISSTDVVSDENVDWINGNCTNASTGFQTCTFNSGIFSVAPNCTVTQNSASNAYSYITNLTSTGLNTISIIGATGAASDSNTILTCVKASTDAKQTAQVYKSIPKVADNINSFSSKISSTGVVSDENVDWINGNCTFSSGEAACTFASNVFSVTPNCFCTPSVNNADACVVKTVSSSAVTFKNYNTGSGVNRDIVARCEKAGTDFKMPIVQPIFSPASIVGSVVGSAYYETGAVATGTTTIPTDDTIPQNTEGTEFMSLAYTPKSASNLLRIKVVGNFSNSASVVCNMALFQDSVANALASTLSSIVSTNAENMTLIHYMPAGTTSSTTFKMRAGCGGAGTLTFNGVGGGRYYGGTMASSITIEEIQQ